MNRYRKSVAAARQTLRGAEVIGMSAYWVCKKYCVNWWQDAELSGGPHNEQATHLFDLSRFLLGEVMDIVSLSQGPNACACVFRFAGGALGTSVYSCEAQDKDIGIRVFSKQGSLVLSGWDFQLTDNSIDGVLSSFEEDIFLQETAAFLRAVCLNRQDLLVSDFADAVKTQQVMDGAQQSWRSGLPISLQGAN
jgi:predicted dehydrogenase